MWPELSWDGGWEMWAEGRQEAQRDLGLSLNKWKPVVSPEQGR